MYEIKIGPFLDSTYKIDIVEEYSCYKFIGHYKEKKYLFFGPMVDKTYTIKFFRIISGLGLKTDIISFERVPKDKKDEALEAISKFRERENYQDKVVKTIKTKKELDAFKIKWDSEFEQFYLNDLINDYRDIWGKLKKHRVYNVITDDVSSLFKIGNCIDQRMVGYVFNQMAASVIGQDQKVVIFSAAYMAVDAAKRFRSISKEEFIKFIEIAWSKI